MPHHTKTIAETGDTTPRKFTLVGDSKYFGPAQSSFNIVQLDSLTTSDSEPLATLAAPVEATMSAQTQPQLHKINAADATAVATPVLPKNQGQNGINIPPVSFSTNSIFNGNFSEFSGLLLNTNLNFSKKELKSMDLNTKIRAALSVLYYKNPISIADSINTLDNSIYNNSINSVFHVDSILIRSARRVQSIVGMPIDAIILAMLGTVSIASWGRYSVEIRQNWSEAVVDYIVIAAKSGSRKSALGTILRAPFDEFANDSISETDMIEMQELAKSCNSLAKARRRKKVLPLAFSNDSSEVVMLELQKHAREMAAWERLTRKNTKIPRILISAATQVSLIRAMADGSGCIAILATEGDFLKSDALLGKGSPVAFLKGHTLEPLSYDSGKQGTLIVQNPALPQIHLVQPDVLAALSGKKYLRKNGVLPRFQVFLCSDVMQGNPAAIDDVGDVALREFQNIIKRIISKNYTHSSPRSVLQLSLSSEARGQIENFEREMVSLAERAENDDLRAFVSKSAGQAVRFGADLHLLAHPDDPCAKPIAGDTMQTGIALCKMLLPHAEALYCRHGLVAREHAQLILNWIGDWRDKAGRYARSSILNFSAPEWYEFTAREAQQGIAALKSDNGLVLTALDVLEQHGWLAQIATGKNTRLCVLNPNIWGAL